ncbi:MAG: Do family serine endopeptidase [Micropepsaceae bacterium]
MSDGSSLPEALPAESKSPKAEVPKARRSVLMISAAAIAIAATAGAVFGFAWSGGGVPAVAEAPTPTPAVSASSSAAPFMVSSGIGAAGTFADIVEHVSPAVVSIRAKVSSPEAPEIKEEDLEQLPPGLRDYFERFRKGAPDRQRSRGGEVQGSGFVVEANGYMVTNNHVVANATDIEVVFADGKKFKAKLIGRDEPTDIAVLKIEGGKAFPTVSFGDDSHVRVGDWVLAVGNPFGLGGTVTAGIVSARGRDDVTGSQFTDFLQIDASINRGNSGGPTFDLGGRVIGMNTAIFSPSGGSVGIGFAIPSNTIQRVVTELKAGGTVTRGWLGVQIQSVDEDTAASLGMANNNGAIVTDVISGSPAQKSGFRTGDVVIRMDGTPVKDNRDLSRRVAALQVNQNAKFGVWRDNRETSINVTVAKRPDQKTLLGQNNQDDDQGMPGQAPGGAKVAALGLDLSAITPEIRQELGLKGDAHGVVITDVDPDSDAAERGLQPGDRIIQASGKAVDSVADVKTAVETAKSLKRPSVLLFIERKTAKVFVAVKLKGKS